VSDNYLYTRLSTYLVHGLLNSSLEYAIASLLARYRLFEVGEVWGLMAVSIKIFRNVTQCSFIQTYRRCGGTCYFSSSGHKIGAAGSSKTSITYLQY
jgi:hypothetical protein